MSATRLWSPITRPAPFWLKPLPRNACSPVADGAALGTCVRCPPLPPPLAAGCPLEGDARTGQDHGVSACAGIDRPLWHGLLTAYALCLGRLFPGRARHLTVPSTSPCTSCGCGCFNLHAHIHSWCTTNLAFAAQNTGVLCSGSCEEHTFVRSEALAHLIGRVAHVHVKRTATATHRVSAR